MNHRIPRLAGLSACAALLAACAAMTPPAPATAANGALVGPNGMTLYTFDRDAGGKSMCNGPCAANWPPLMAPASASAAGGWSVVTRDDGARQWAYQGKPVYYWVKDAKPGDRTGDGVNNVWHVARP